jgi:hypothetical protein
LDARLTTLFGKRVIVVKSKEVETGCTLAEYSKEGYRSKRAVLPMLMMMISIIRSYVVLVTDNVVK